MKLKFHHLFIMYSKFYILDCIFFCLFMIFSSVYNVCTSRNSFCQMFNLCSLFSYFKSIFKSSWRNFNSSNRYCCKWEFLYYSLSVWYFQISFFQIIFIKIFLYFLSNSNTIFWQISSKLSSSTIAMKSSPPICPTKLLSSSFA